MSQGSGLGEIKPSQIKAVDKEVILLTPVIIGNTDLPSSYIKKKVNYKSGSALTTERIFPQTAKDKIGGVLIRMPTQGVRDYLDTMVKLECLMSDDDMVRFLEQEINTCRGEKIQLMNPVQKLEKAILDSKLFEQLPQAT